MTYRQLRTDFGAWLYVAGMPHVHSVSSGVLVYAGTIDESWPKEAGLAHAFEHMVFQGTARFPDSRSAADYLESVGGSSNAWTWKEHTFFHAHAPDTDWKRTIIWLVEILNAPRFDSKKIGSEMKIILEEIKRHRDNPSSYVGEAGEALLYSDHPLGRSTLGLEESVSSFQKEDFLSWQAQHYYPENFAFLVAGNVNAKSVLDFINKSFSSAATKQNRRLPLFDLPHPPDFKPPINAEKIVEREVEQVNIYLAAPIPGFYTRETAVLDFFSDMLGAGSSFPLFQEVRDKLGLCYSIGSGVYRWDDVGSFIIFLGTDVKRWKLALDTIFKVIRKSAGDPALLKKTKRVLKGRLAIGVDSSFEVLNKMSMDMVFCGLPRGLEETLAEIQSVTLNEVWQAVRHYLTPEKFVRAFVAPKGFKTS